MLRSLKSVDGVSISLVGVEAGAVGGIDGSIVGSGSVVYRKISELQSDNQNTMHKGTQPQLLSPTI